MSFSKDGIALATTKAILGPAAREDVQKKRKWISIIWSIDSASTLLFSIMININNWLLSCGNLMPAAVGIIPRPCLWDLDSLHIHHHIHHYVVYVGPFFRLPMESTGWVVWVQNCESRVMGLIPTQWTGMLYRYVVRWLKIAFCPQGLVDTIGRWKNGPAYSN